MTLFTKIIQRELPADIVYEDEICIAIKDINPTAPIHYLMIPKKEIESVDHATQEDASILSHLLLKAAEVAKKEGLDKEGYRLVTNVGENAGQTVHHLHVHILGGRALGALG